MEGDRTRETIQRIADTLGVPHSAFYEPDTLQADSTPEATFQAMELLALFSAIRDPESRLVCLDYVRRHAEDTPPAATNSRIRHVHGL